MKRLKYALVFAALIGSVSTLLATGPLSPAPFFTALDNNGNIIPGAKICTYLAGTTTPTTTWTDVNLSVPNPNPILADSSGRWVAFLAAATSYKYVFQDASGTTGNCDGVTLRTQDNISSGPTLGGANTWTALQTFGNTSAANGLFSATLGVSGATTLSSTLGVGGSTNLTGAVTFGSTVGTNGTWTPADASGASLTFTTPSGVYQKIGKLIYFSGALTYPTTGSALAAAIGGLPSANSTAVASVSIGYQTNSAPAGMTALIQASGSTVQFYTAAGVAVPNSTLTGSLIEISGTYLTP